MSKRTSSTHETHKSVFPCFLFFSLNILAPNVSKPLSCSAPPLPPFCSQIKPLREPLVSEWSSMDFHTSLLFSIRFFYSFPIHYLSFVFFFSFFSFFFFCVCVMQQVCVVSDLGKYFIILGIQSLKGMGLFLFSFFMDYSKIWVCVTSSV